jgi:excisionase family DNA binding protein
MNQYSPISADTGAFESPPEKLITVKAAANALGLPDWKLRRACQSGEIPSYTLLNSRRLVKLSEVLAAIEASRQGGDRS